VHDDAERTVHDADKKKSRSRLSVFRSLASSSSTRSREYEEELQRHTNDSNGSSSRPRPTSQEKKSRAMSPSLPIYKNPHQGEILRRKLISPPPPMPSPSASPIGLRLGLGAKEEGIKANVYHPPDTVEAPKPDLTKPTAIRKPLSLGPKEDYDNEDSKTDIRDYTGFKKEKAATLRVPLIVAPSSKSPSDEAPARAVLNWTAEGEADEAVEDTEDELMEEDLHGDCVCPDCEPRMTAALSESYETPWTRPARKKYLADRRQLQIEAMKKRNAVMPNLVHQENDKHDAVPTKERELKADEVDAKKGNSKVAVVPILVDSVAGKGAQTGVTDDVLKEEIDQEAILRKEEERIKRTKSEAKRLSNDFSSGLSTGGGGARAMMRQLEEADRLEKKAMMQRIKSPPVLAKEKEEEVRVMGAVKDTPIRPFTVPRRLSDGALPPSNAPQRTPSPQLQQQQQQQSKKKDVSPSAEELSKAKKRDHRLSTPLTPSMLIRRELSLGIPLHANSAIPRSSWPAHPPTRAASPRLTSPTTLEDIAEVPSRPETNLGSGNSTPRRANTIGHGHSSSPLARPDNFRRTPATSNNGGAKVKRSSSLSGKPASLQSRPGQGNGLGLNLTLHAQSTEGPAKHKTRMTFKDLVARIKS
jgi:hypothetical protein